MTVYDFVCAMVRGPQSGRLYVAPMNITLARLREWARERWGADIVEAYPGVVAERATVEVLEANGVLNLARTIRLGGAK